MRYDALAWRDRDDGVDAQDSAGPTGAKLSLARDTWQCRTAGGEDDTVCG